MRVYDPLWLEHIIRETDLIWIGMGGQRVYFSYRTDLDLMLQETNEISQDLEEEDSGPKDVRANHRESIHSVKDLLPDTHGHYDFPTLLQLKELRPSDLSDRLWGDSYIKAFFQFVGYKIASVSQ